MGATSGTWTANTFGAPEFTLNFWSWLVHSCVFVVIFRLRQWCWKLNGIDVLFMDFLLYWITVLVITRCPYQVWTYILYAIISQCIYSVNWLFVNGNIFFYEETGVAVVVYRKFHQQITKMMPDIIRGL
jgi:hypothetical protein